MVKQVKQAKADIYLRDTDSQSLFNNSGELSFKYYHEWNDCYNPTTGETAQIEGEIYDEDTNSYKPNCPEGYLPVFNGRQSALWDNLVSCFPERIQDMYKTMRNNGLSYSDMFAKYKEFWKLWCENLYNADAFGYANTGNFEKAFGDKLQMMNFFFYKRQRYLDSKYCCGSSVSNTLRLRLSETGKGLAIKYYQALYSSLQWGIGSFAIQRNINPGTYSYQPWGIKNPQDATFDIDDADLITELSTYVKGFNGVTITGLEGIGNFKFDSSMSILKRLTRFIMNYSAAKPNTNELGKYFDLSGMSMLKQVIVRNVKNLTNSIVISSDIIEEIDFTGTPIVGVTTPPSDSLTKLVLPDTIVALKLVGYSNLTNINVKVDGYSHVDEFEIKDCPNIDPLRFLGYCVDANAPLTQVTLEDINIELDDISILLYLANKKANITGKIVINDSVRVTLEQKLLFMEAWGDVDNVDNPLYITYKQYNLINIAIKLNSYIYQVGTYQLKINPNPSNGNDVTNVTWSIDDNKFAIINKSGLLTVNSIGSKDTDDSITIRVSVTLTSGSTIDAMKVIKMYKRDCEVGDYLFSDGTYGSSLNDSICSPIGIVFYLEPNIKKRTLGLAVSLADFNPLNHCWGLYDGLDGSSWNPIPNIKLNEYTGTVYDISSIPNITSYNFANDANMLDPSGDIDGFKVYSDTHALGDIGFIPITSIMINELGLAKYLKDLNLQEDDLIAKGQLNTIKILRHRDRILQDSNINKPIPSSSDTMSELDSLDKCISEIITTEGNQKYAQFYYPAASYAHVYEPKLPAGEELNSDFKSGHWFLPSVGELARISFYVTHGYENKDKYAIFSNGYLASVFYQFKGFYWASSERTSSSAWTVRVNDGNLLYGNNNYLKSITSTSLELRLVSVLDL